MAAHSLLRDLSQGLAVVALAAFGLLAALLGGSASGQVAAIFPPWWDGLRTLNAAAEGGSVLQLGSARFIVLVAPDDLHGRERLWRAGVWLILNLGTFPGCGSTKGVKPDDKSIATRG